VVSEWISLNALFLSKHVWKHGIASNYSPKSSLERVQLPARALVRLPVPVCVCDGCPALAAYLFMVGFRPRSGASPRPPIVTVLLSKHLRCLPVCRRPFIMPPVHTVLDHPNATTNSECGLPNQFIPWQKPTLETYVWEIKFKRNPLPSGSKGMPGAWSSFALVVHLYQKAVNLLAFTLWQEHLLGNAHKLVVNSCQQYGNPYIMVDRRKQLKEKIKTKNSQLDVVEVK
jgi:hypothetical protein